MYELKLPDTSYASGLRQEKEGLQYIHTFTPGTHNA